jgi:hypothetical protein
MDAKTKAKIRKVTEVAEEKTDSLLSRVIAHPASWIIVLVWTVASVAVGKFVL